MVRSISTFCLLSLALFTQAQKVTVSERIPIQRSYEIIGKVQDRILLYKDEGKDNLIDVFDASLQHLYTRDLKLDKRKTILYGVIPQDSSLITYSGHREDDKTFSVLGRRFSKEVICSDTSYIIDHVKELKLHKLKFASSMDNRYSIIYSLPTDHLISIVFLDNTDMSVVWTKEVLVDNFNVEDDLWDILFSPSGKIYLAFFDPSKKLKKKQPQIQLIGLNGSNNVEVYEFLIKQKYILDFEARYDKNNDGVVLTGLTSNKNDDTPEAYYFANTIRYDETGKHTVKTTPLDQKFVNETYGKKLGKHKSFDNFLTRDVVVRNDGGALLFTEMERKYYRRATNTPGMVRSLNRSYVDIHTEDVVIISINPDGSEAWKRSLHKKQYSQDDDGVFSSYFLFGTPSEMKLIYNDEIRNDIMVSEYIIDPLGEYDRNSLLSTEYQKLKLRWIDALQVSSTELLVPSEHNKKVKLVKVSYK